MWLHKPPHTSFSAPSLPRQQSRAKDDRSNPIASNPGWIVEGRKLLIWRGIILFVPVQIQQSPRQTQGLLLGHRLMSEPIQQCYQLHMFAGCSPEKGSEGVRENCSSSSYHCWRVSFSIMNLLLKKQYLFWVLERIVCVREKHYRRCCHSSINTSTNFVCG